MDGSEHAMSPYLLMILIGSQAIFSASDLLGRTNMMNAGSFSPANFMKWWFVVYMAIRTVATLGQLYVFSAVKMGKTMALFGAASIVIANVLGWLYMGDVLSTGTYVGIALAILAFLVLALL
jgi:uncharacterized membrane protein